MTNNDRETLEKLLDSIKPTQSQKNRSTTNSLGETENKEGETEGISLAPGPSMRDTKRKKPNEKETTEPFEDTSDLGDSSDSELEEDPSYWEIKADSEDDLSSSDTSDTSFGGSNSSDGTSNEEKQESGRQQQRGVFIYNPQVVVGSSARSQQSKQELVEEYNRRMS